MNSEPYDCLRHRFQRLSHLRGALAVLHWDHAVMMPDGGAPGRAEQLATLKQLAHENLADPRVGDWLDEAEAAPPEDPWAAANLREMRRHWRHAVAVPSELIAAGARAASACEMAWRAARPANDFAAVAAPLERVVALTRELAQAKAAALGLTPYDALLDTYEPGLRATRVEALFGELESFLPALLAAAVARQGGAERPPPTALALDGQRRLARRVAHTLGFDFHHGRLDESHHPFTGGVPDDVRITSRYDPTDLLSGLYAVIHECGHAAYERGRPAAWRGQPVGQAMGMAVHESQSLLFEMQAARGPGFVGHLARLVAAETGADEAESFLRQARHVAPGLIRVEADEVSYPLHIVLRTRLERELLSGGLAVADLPAAWTDGMRNLLGIEVANDRDGCLQDIHWMTGSFGYFPTYTLGAIAAAQLFERAKAEIADLEEALARGDFGPLLAWLAWAVAGKGRLHGTAEALLEEVTGRGFDLGCFRAHLEARYLP